MLCLSLDVVPRTLAPNNRDPKERDQDYIEEMRNEWKKTQRESGRQFVKLAKRREEERLRRIEEEWWDEAKELKKEIGEEEWERELKSMRREGEKYKCNFNNGHRAKLRALLIKEKREIPFWLTREAREQWEVTITIEEGRSINRSRRSRRVREDTMWASWTQRRKIREQGVRLDIEREIGDRISWLESTPKSVRVQQVWDPSPIHMERTVQFSQQETTYFKRHNSQ